ncbi:MAG: MFS transporter [Candidatus Aquicultor sp.]
MDKNHNEQGIDRLTETEVLETEATSPEAALIETGTRRWSLFSSLGYAEYRYLWSGALLSNIGTWIQSVALGLFVFQLTHSEFALGFVTFSSSIPTFFLALVGGIVADRYQRRSLIIATQVVQMLLALTLGILISLHAATVVTIVVISLITGIASSFGFPAWLSLIPELVPKKDLLNAVALNSAQFNVARLVGPAIAGLIIGSLGVAASFYINSLSFLAVIIALLLIKPPPVKTRQSEMSAWQNFTEGIKYAKEHASAAVLLICVGTLTMFGMSHTTLMPVYAIDILKTGAQGLGYLFAATGLGAVTGALIVAGLTHIIPRRNLIKLGLFSYGILLLVFAFSKIFIISLLAQVGIGIAFLTTTSSINTSLQLMAPTQIRGRVMSLFVWAFMGLFPIGSLIVGSLARFIGSPPTLAIGATVLLIASAILYFRPHLLENVG